MSQRILVIDDQKDWFDLLNSAGIPDMEFEYLGEFKNVPKYLKDNPVNLILMDWNLGDSADGVEITKALKKSSHTRTIPVVMLSGNLEKTKMAFALNEGADDYVEKPFELNYLISKINSNLRKYGANLEHKKMYVKNILLDENTYTVDFKGQKTKLRRKEFRILQALIQSPDRVFTRTELNDMSHPGFVVSGRTIDTLVRHIRGSMKCDDIIETVHGQGYKINKSLFD